MNVTVKAILGTEKYYTEVTAGENKIITDEPVEKVAKTKDSIHLKFWQLLWRVVRLRL